MRFFDMENKPLQWGEMDFTKGRLQEDTLLIARHPGVEAIPEQGHYREELHENGGVTRCWVVDVPGVPGTDPWEEWEHICRFVPFTDAELAALEGVRQRSARLETLLQSGVLRQDLSAAVTELVTKLLTGGNTWKGESELGDWEEETENGL